MKRVVVTGMGLVTPLGCGTDINWKNLISGESGAKKISNFDVSNKIRKLLVSRNMAEVITWTFCSEKNENLLSKDNLNIKIKNPISSDLSCLRTNLISNLLRIIKLNLH